MEDYRLAYQSQAVQGLIGLEESVRTDLMLYLEGILADPQGWSNEITGQAHPMSPDLRGILTQGPSPKEGVLTLFLIREELREVLIMSVALTPIS